MANLTADTRVAFLVAPEGTEQVELTQPWEAVADAGGTPELISIDEVGSVTAFRHLDRGDSFDVDHDISVARADDYAALVLPGGVANPDRLRTDLAALAFVAEFAERDLPIAAICHAPWTLIDAGVASGRRLTSYPSLATDLRNAGAEWVDEEVVVDGNLVTSRRPDDLPAFSAALLDRISANG